MVKVAIMQIIIALQEIGLNQGKSQGSDRTLLYHRDERLKRGQRERETEIERPWP